MSRQKKKRNRTQKRSFSGPTPARPATSPRSSLTKAWKVRTESGVARRGPNCKKAHREAPQCSADHKKLGPSAHQHLRVGLQLGCNHLILPCIVQ